MTKTTIPLTTTSSVDFDDVFAAVPKLGDVLEGSSTSLPTPEEPSTEGTPVKKEEDYSEWGGKDALLAIYDEIVFENGYREDITLRKMSFCFKTRSSQDMVNINTYLDRLNAKSMNTYQTYANYFTLAASLRRFQQHDFQEATLQQVYEHLLILDSAVIDILLGELSKFDIKIAKA